MRHPGSPRPIRLTVRIDVQDDFRDLLPICAIAFGVEKAGRLLVLLVIAREHVGHRCCVSDGRIKWGLLHDVSPLTALWCGRSIMATSHAKQLPSSHRVMPLSAIIPADKDAI